MAIKHKEIAERMKLCRELAEKSVDEIAPAIGATPDEYRAYESGDVDIPVSVLYEVCKVMEISMTELLTGERARLKMYDLTRAGRGVTVERNTAYKYANLAAEFSDRKIEPLMVIVEPSPVDEPIHTNFHKGQEYHYCLEGSFVLQIGDKKLTISKGDSIYFDSGYPHGMKAIGNKEACILVIVI